ncbi:hypothetical protein ACF0H5_003926 [Mactra antiquata]
MTSLKEKLNITICGGGNGAHTFAGISSLVKNANVTVVTIFENEAERWAETMGKNGFEVKFKGDKKVTIAPEDVKFKVTKEVKSVIPDSDLVVICVPAYTHNIYMNLISPYLNKNCPIVGMPGQPGFEYEALTILKEHGKTNTIMSIETMPWACRIIKYGECVEVLGTKDEVCYTLVDKLGGGTKVGQSHVEDVMQALLGSKPVLSRMENILKYTFLCRPTIHPPIMYAKWKSWDGLPLETPPLFYQGVDEEAVRYLDGLTEEVTQTAAALDNKFPELGFSGVSTMKEWLIDHYSDQISDKSSLLTCLQTNSAYDGLVHPMTKTSDGKFVPDFQYRYTREDVPYGLIVLRQIASMVEVSTPIIDEIIKWAETKLGTQYLKDGKLCNIDRKSGRLPLTYGITTIEEFFQFFK